MKHLILIIFITIFYTGCFSSYPMNLSKDEYNMLSLQERITLKEKQSKLDNERKIESLRNQRQREKYEYAIALREAEKIERLYEQNNQRLFVSFHNGVIKQRSKGYYISPFEIATYEVKKVPVYTKNSRYRQYNLWVSFQPEGFYIGVKPPKAFNHLDSFIYSNIRKLIEKSHNKPVIIPRSRKWYKEHTYTISLHNPFNAKDLKATLYLD